MVSGSGLAVRDRSNRRAGEPSSVFQSCNRIPNPDSLPPVPVFITSVTFPPGPLGRYSRFMSAGTGTARFRCAQCEQSEENCECEKYCCLCQSVIDVRFCADGLMYCDPC